MNTPPPDAVCIEPLCSLDAVTTRTSADVWLTDDGVLVDVDEWVCVVHA